jgi:hypothetical protein
MKRIILAVFGSIVLVAMTGCESMKFSNFTGEQTAWPTGNSFRDGGFALPTYRGWPEKSYDVVGLIQFDKPNIDWNQGDMNQATKLAKQAGADAIILLPRGLDPSPTTIASRQKLGITADQTVALAIKWK